MKALLIIFGQDLQDEQDFSKVELAICFGVPSAITLVEHDLSHSPSWGRCGSLAGSGT